MPTKTEPTGLDAVRAREAETAQVCQRIVALQEELRQAIEAYHLHAADLRQHVEDYRLHRVEPGWLMKLDNDLRGSLMHGPPHHPIRLEQ
jgi:hypothetical protein